MKNKTLKIIVIVLAVALAVTGGALVYNLLKPEIVLPNPVGTPNDLPKIGEKPVPPKNSEKNTSSDATSDKKAGNSSKPASSSSSKPSSKPISSKPISSIPIESTSKVQSNEQKVVRGKITSLSTTYITIKEEKTGEEMSFYRESATVDGKLAEELIADIYYLGASIDEAYVTKIVTFLP